MNFTYKSYTQLIELLKERGYEFADYASCDSFERCVILRHDLDYELNKSLKIAELEREEGVSSTYFVLITSDFYNAFSVEALNVFEKLKKLGHNIGLHFDEKRYENDARISRSMSDLISDEIFMLEKIVGKIDAVSMHRPSEKTLESDISIPGIANSYGRKFFSEFKYLSDSRMRWRENPVEIINSGKYNKIQILTHPFWYFETEQRIEEIIGNFIACKGEYQSERYDIFNNNFTNLIEVLGKQEEK